MKIKKTIMSVVTAALIAVSATGISVNAVEALYEYIADDHGIGTLTWYKPTEKRAELPIQVERINIGAFNSDDLQTVVLHENVSTIEDGAFSLCPNLLNIEVSEDNQVFSSVDGVLFNKWMTKLICYPAGKTDTSYTIPDTVTSISPLAFNGCRNLTEITIPKGVEQIERSTFESCTGITNIVLPTGLICIGECAFQGCENLSAITIPDSVMYIDNQAFWDTEIYNVNQTEGLVYIDRWLIRGDDTLETVEIKEGTRGIASYAFSYCTKLKKVKIPESVSAIGIHTFTETSIWDNADVVNGITYLDNWIIGADLSLKTVEIADGTKGIAPLVFSYSENIQSANIPESVTFIGHEAFGNCPNMKSVVINNPNAYIGKFALGYTSRYSASGLTYTKNKDFVISCYEGSTADEYAKKSLLDCVYLEGSPEDSEMDSFPIIPIVAGGVIIGTGAVTAAVIIKKKRR